MHRTKNTLARLEKNRESFIFVINLLILKNYKFFC